MNRALFVAGYLWALPFTVFGFLAALVSLSKPYAVKDGAVLCLAGTWFGWALRKGNFAAQTHAGVIFTTTVLDLADEVDARLIRHELVHFRQCRVFGVFQPILYMLASALLFVMGKRAYWDNPFEIEARKEAGR